MDRSSGDSVTEDDEGKPEGVPVLPNHQEQHQSGIEADYESQDAGVRPAEGEGRKKSEGGEGPLSSDAPEVSSTIPCKGLTKYCVKRGTSGFWGF